MDIDNLVRMANRIGQFYAAMPDREEALEGIATHIRKFWEPRMRRALLEQMAQGAPAELLPLVAEAIERRRELLA